MDDANTIATGLGLIALGLMFTILGFTIYRPAKAKGLSGKELLEWEKTKKYGRRAGPIFIALGCLFVYWGIAPHLHLL